jgi:uncharacterized membrane protein
MAHQAGIRTIRELAQNGAVNPNVVHETHLSVTDRVALGITSRVGTIWCVLVFAGIALIALPAAVASGDPIIIVAWVSQAFLQLVLLPLLMVGQNLQGRHSEFRAEADYQTNLKAFADTEKILAHLDSQDAQILEIVTALKATSVQSGKPSRRKTTL